MQTLSQIRHLINNFLMMEHKCSRWWLCHLQMLNHQLISWFFLLYLLLQTSHMLIITFVLFCKVFDVLIKIAILSHQEIWHLIQCHIRCRFLIFIFLWFFGLFFLGGLWINTLNWLISISLNLTSIFKIICFTFSSNKWSQNVFAFFGVGRVGLSLSW